MRNEHRQSAGSGLLLGMAAGAALGLLLHGLGALSLRSLCQLCALGAAVAARWLLPQRFMPAALAGCGTLTGMALCFALGSSGGRKLQRFYPHQERNRYIAGR